MNISSIIVGRPILAKKLIAQMLPLKRLSAQVTSSYQNMTFRFNLFGFIGFTLSRNYSNKYQLVYEKWFHLTGSVHNWNQWLVLSWGSSSWFNTFMSSDCGSSLGLSGYQVKVLLSFGKLIQVRCQLIFKPLFFFVLSILKKIYSF